MWRWVLCVQVWRCTRPSWRTCSVWWRWTKWPSRSVRPSPSRTTCPTYRSSSSICSRPLSHISTGNLIIRSINRSIDQSMHMWHSAGFVRGLENLECASILFSQFKVLKMLEFAKLALKSLQFLMSIYLLHINICMRDYGITDVSKYVNIVSKRIHIASANVALRKYCIMRQWSCKPLTSPLGGAVVR